MTVLITGGAGFIGANVADHHLASGDDVVLFDDLSRAGSRDNLAWLAARHPSGLTFVEGDVRDFAAVVEATSPDLERVYHMAAQVAVTTSVVNPRLDFDTNAAGTFNVLEAVRLVAPEAMVIYASTNKVYGAMDDVAIVEEADRYSYRDLPFGVGEDRPLDFHSPYGCSKGCGDQYVHDYHRIFGLRTVVMRQSCIYGRRQFGVEDQGWLAHFCIAARAGSPVAIYGNGKQVRDVLWIDDLIAAYEAAAERIEFVAGRTYNIGGGTENALSIWREFGPKLEALVGRAIPVTYGDWRPGDQPIYVSDIRKAQRELDWRPRVGIEQGLRELWRWVDENAELLLGRSPALVR